MKIILNELFLKINFFTIFCSQWLPAHPQHARIHHADLRRTAKEWLPRTTCSTISGGSGSGSGHSDSNSYGNSEYGSTSGAAESTTSARYANGNGEPVWSSDAGKHFSPPFTMNVVYSLICLCTSVDCNFFFKNLPFPQKIFQDLECSGSLVECLTWDRGALGSHLTGVTVLWFLSKRH